MADIYKGKSYSLSPSQIKGLANICYREQGGNDAGVRACATHMLNYYEKYQSKNYSNPYDCTLKSGWYGKESFNLPYVNGNSAPQKVIDAVSDVIKNGNRSLPSFIDEYDCTSDIKTAKNNGYSFNPEDRSQYKKDITIITNRYGSTYTFFCFPDGANGTTDAFGYISKPSKIETPVNNTSQNTNPTQLNTSEIVEKATRWMESIAQDDSHGYDQQYRWGERGDYDCSSLTISAFKQAGVPLTCTYTGDMYNDMTKKGFKDVTSGINISTGSGLKRGDVLLNHQKHVAVYCGNGKQVDAIGNENNGSATGGKPGDQTGREILIRNYNGSYNWDVVLRYIGNSNISNTITIPNNTYINNTAPDKVKFVATEVSKGSISDSVLLVQKLLKAQGYLGADGKELELDGEAGENTVYAIMSFQMDNNLEADGIAGKNTLTLLMKGLATT